MKYVAVLLAQDARLATKRLGVLESLSSQEVLRSEFVPVALGAG